MIKSIPLDDSVVDRPLTFLPVSSRFTGDDRRLLVKLASDHVADMVSKIDRVPGEDLVHLVAMGSTEKYGPNRNGDGFTKRALQKFHDTFVKSAYWYRDHRNRFDRDPHFGRVKASSYNSDMDRVELIVGLYATPSAAARTNGKVADKELEKLANDSQLPVSMSCRVPNDVCVICNNKAPSRQQYCRGYDEGGNCPGGGCFSKLGQVLDDGRQLYVDNPEPHFFDISKVHRGADRTAFTTGLLKAANAKTVTGGAELAEMYGMYDDELDPFAPKVPGVRDLLCKLAAEESTVAANNLVVVFNQELDSSVNVENINPLALVKSSIAANVMLPIETFFAASGDKVDAASVRASLPGIFGKLLSNHEKVAGVVAFLTSGRANRESDFAVAKLAAAGHAFDSKSVMTRARLAAIRGKKPHKKCGSAGDYDKAVAYAAYQVAFISQNIDPEFSSKLVTAHNVS